MMEAIERLRESFSEARSAKQEQWYGLYLDGLVEVNIGPRNERLLNAIVWRNTVTHEQGTLARVPKSQLVDTLGVLLNELQRLRKIRKLKAAA
jgi:hypothetical protein